MRLLGAASLGGFSRLWLARRVRLLATLLCFLLKAAACVARLRLAWRVCLLAVFALRSSGIEASVALPGLARLVHLLAAFALPSSKARDLRGVAGTFVPCTFACGFSFAPFGSSLAAGNVQMLVLSSG